MENIVEKSVRVGSAGYYWHVAWHCSAVADKATKERVKLPNLQ